MGQTGETTGEQNAQTRPAHLFDREKAREAGLRSAAARRERKAEREAAAEFERLTVSQRVATSQAATLTYAKLRRVHEALVDAAEAGNLAAARELRAWVQLGLAIPDDGTVDMDAPLASLNPAQRAALTARLVRDVYGEGEGSDPA